MLARDVGFRDEFGGIPEARWMRAMTFERLVRDKRFASELATTAVRRLDLARPTKVVIVNARLNVERTAELLAEAHGRAVDEGAATMLHGLAIPFVGFEGDGATDVKPDFAVVAPQRPENEGDEVRASWLILGDAKDYERVRSRIDDARLLKGFLQVALGAESASGWSRLPGDMNVHRYGVLAVPRNAFLQPEALVELLDDHRDEVRMRVDQRRRETAATVFDEDTTAIVDYVSHLEAAFDPAACVSCTLFAFCRDELRRSGNPEDLLVEIGIPKPQRPYVAGLLDGGEGLREIRERRVAAEAAYEESQRLERALAALGAAPRSSVGSQTDAPRRRRQPARRRKRAAPGANRAAVLAALHERPGASAGEVAQPTGIPRSTVAPTLSRLIAAGAVERTELPGGGVGFRPAAE